jgi:hypothetical protein
MIIIAIVLFIIIETLNIATLYFKPELKVGNGIGVFKAFEASKQYPEIWLNILLTGWLVPN